MKDRDDLNNVGTNLRALFMAIKGADSIMDRDEADALEVLADSVLAGFEAVKASIESAPTALAA